MRRYDCAQIGSSSIADEWQALVLLRVNYDNECIAGILETWV